jgi:sarcosine oxidase / L-pipecolate oxidase
MADPSASYLIVGAGVFGASTALHLIQKYPTATVSLVDRAPFPSQVAASWDLNKVVRADYTDIVYVEKVLEAKKKWRGDPLFSPYYHESGLVYIAAGDFARTVVDNYKRLGAEEDVQLVAPDEAKELYGGMFRDADYAGVSEVLVNKSSGWAEARNALKNVIKASIDAGVEYVEAEIASLEFGNGGSCSGVRSTTGKTFSATHTILCTGAGTAKLLADSAPDREELQVGGRMVAAAICSSIATLTPDAAAEFSKGPVCCQDVSPGEGSFLPYFHSAPLPKKYKKDSRLSNKKGRGLCEYRRQHPTQRKRKRAQVLARYFLSKHGPALLRPPDLYAPA